MERAIVLTTLPHFIALAFAFTTPWYASVVLLSSSLSVAWHVNYERKNWLYYADHLMAGVWCASDVYLLPTPSVVGLNAIVFLLNVLATTEALHSWWHLLSASKSIYVAYLVFHRHPFS